MGYEMKLSYSIINSEVIAFNDDDPDTITDESDRFVKGGFTAGNSYTVSGSTSNDGTYLVDTVVAGTLTLDAGESLSDEVAGELVTIGSVDITFSPLVNGGYAIPEHRERRQYTSPNGDLIVNEIFAKGRWEIPVNNISKADYDIIYSWWDNMLKLVYTPDTDDLGTYYYIRIINDDIPLQLMGASWQDKYEGMLILREVPALS